MKISVIGTGYVGLIQSVGLSKLGFEVTGIDIDERKVKKLNSGISTLYEDNLEEELKKFINENLKFTSSYEPISNSDVIFLCVGTPQDDFGNADLKFLYSAVESIKKYIDNKPKTVVIKSTVPVGTCRKIQEILKDYPVEVVSNPEFLREGIAFKDFFEPERIVLGFENPENNRSINLLKKVYGHFEKNNVPFVISSWETSELIKYASNAFLAAKISFINEISKLSDKVGADIKTISEAMGMDERIGAKFLNAGIGYGGSCFPKDVKALAKQFESFEIESKIITSTENVNQAQTTWFFENKIKKYYGNVSGKTFAVLGLAFKPNTDDLRESKAIELINILLKNGAIVKGFDYIEKARENTLNKYILSDSKSIGYSLHILDHLEDAVFETDGIVIATEYDFNIENWMKIKELVKEPVIFDGKNVLDSKKLKSLGYTYFGVGRN
ncbi:UDP-glucose/GDP-mannose dehydrogenase family protein [Methanococcus maripaludis]|uniref:UDP-glucose 6-dehydrogenase n=2 Tax=Methanococcus maripaludis TaxID=39152 RepID=A0A7J9PHQ3_METMI|nr:UDP-glucose/GDP-mannose dehydrogenase family protein [Methanococcus maripaludis]MBA2862314.1 UDPglucose 6-dehydrogenase [Methanococcus maripaludis]